MLTFRISAAACSVTPSVKQHSDPAHHPLPSRKCSVAVRAASPAMGKKMVIVGGVAGGASCAARLRRLNETAEITIFERGPYVSFANCGLPYFVGDVIKV